jgi:hypothetical protein
MYTLLARLSQVLFWEGSAYSPSGTAPASMSMWPSLTEAWGNLEYFHVIRLAFTKGLVRAIMVHGPASVPKTKDDGEEGRVASPEEELEFMLRPPGPCAAWMA